MCRSAGLLSVYFRCTFGTPWHRTFSLLLPYSLPTGAAFFGVKKMEKSGRPNPLFRCTENPENSPHVADCGAPMLSCSVGSARRRTRASVVEAFRNRACAALSRFSQNAARSCVMDSACTPT